MALDLNYTSADFGLAFQHHVLAVFLTHAAAMRRFRSIFDPLLFEDPIDQRIGECLQSVYDEAKAIPTRATLEQVIRTSTKDKALRAECIERAAKYYKRRSEDAEFVLNRVREFSKVRAVANAVITSARDVESNHLPNILPRMRAALSVGDDLSDTGVDYLRNLPRRNALRKQGKLQPPTISTGFPHFDFVLRGGCSKGQLVFAIASAKKGKSIFLLNLALGAVRAGQRVLYVSLELNDEDVQTRMDMRLAGPRKHVLAKDDPDAFAAYITNRAKTTFTGALHVKYYPAKTVTCAKLTALMDALRAEGANVDVLVVDHADLMVAEDVSRQASRSEKEGQAYLELKALAQTQDVLVYTACQANKGAAGKDSVEAVDAAWSYEKIAHCDLAVSINQTRDEAKEKLARISIVAARRHESNVNVEIRFDPSCYYMSSTRLYDGFMSRIPTSFDKDMGGGERAGFRTVSKLKEKLQESADKKRRDERPPKTKGRK